MILNWQKTVFINFPGRSEFEVRKKIEQVVPFPPAAKTKRAARYLGFMGGPDALGVAWKRPCRRSLACARHVRSLGPSLVEVVVAFKVFVVSILRFHFQLVPLCSEVVNDFGFAIDVATATPRFSLGSGVLFHLRVLGFHVGIHHLAATARATAYRTTKQSEVFCDLCDMLDEAATPDAAIMHPGQAEWRMSSPINFLRKIVREVEVVPGVVGLPSSDLQKRVVGILSRLGGGELIRVLTKRVERLGLEFSDGLAQNLILIATVWQSMSSLSYSLRFSRLFAMPGLLLGGMVIILHRTAGWVALLWQGTTSDTTPFALWWR